MASMLSRCYDSLEMPEPPKPYTNIRITDRDEVPDRNAEVPIETIVTKWFAKGAFDNLNEQARDILLMSIETGCRQSEIHDLPSDAIVLDTPVPFINVTNEDGEVKREVKNTSSFRRIPLVGVALSAARRHLFQRSTRHAHAADFRFLPVPLFHTLLSQRADGLSRSAALANFSDVDRCPQV